MVDINLIGDDKTGEEERVEEFTQTSSMDTQELAFEERTETFDTTKTAGFSQKRNYSSLIATLIIMAVIILLGSSIYFFMFSDEGQDSELPVYQPPEASNIEEPLSDEELAEYDINLGQEDFADETEIVEETPTAVIEEPAPVETSQPIEESPAPRPAPRRDTRPLNTGPSPDHVTATRDAIQAVTSLLSMVPADLSTTLLSYTGQRVRLEFVSGTAASARDFATRLNQVWGSGNFKVVSEAQVAANGGYLDKVLISGRMSGAAPANGGSREQTVAQIKDWINATARQLGLSVKELKTQPPTYSGGGQSTPILVRLYGGQAGVTDFLQEMGNRSLNVELMKVLLVSPDMVNYTDDRLILVLNMLLRE